MNYIYVRKSEILKKELIESIKANLFNKKKEHNGMFLHRK